MTRVVRAVLIACLAGCGPRPEPSLRGSLTVDPPEPDFGIVPIHEVRLLQLKLGNAGPGPLKLLGLEGVTRDGAFDLPILHERVLEAGETHLVHLQFTTRATTHLARHEARYLVRTDAGDVELTVRATSVFVDCSLQLLDLGSVLVGESLEHTFQLLNESPLPAALSIGQPLPLTGDPGVFARFDAGTYALAPGEAFPLTLRFTPATVESYATKVEMRMNPLCPPADVMIRGVGVTRLAWCLDGSFSPLGGGLEVQNHGIEPLELRDLAVTGNFELLTDGGVIVPGAVQVPGVGVAPARVRMPIRFRPGFSGEHHGTFTASTGHPSQPTLSCPLIGRN